ncbi:hypothetical protein C9374_005693 [Naegleria lovaniensis]|uniref:Large ribosomal subunit protein uL15 n=1 Tax=Naegleria lovaniensis TaxID=51637 RepID=A0AA88GJ12_NAELO|nr:uncharacterized protein C9374_005693 [Naegleria lovaniensis]KAG2381901.1 hypothetical protein C9374_005693 [Naegleria lovaniensis]
MATTKKKCRKLRGHVTHGHGRVGKHRKHPGGRGMAGGQHHHRIWVDRFHPGYFGKIGIRRFHMNKNHFLTTSVNLDELWKIAGEQVYNQAKEGKFGTKAVVIDAHKAGFDKVLGRGDLPKIPIVVRARLFSKSAEEKIKAVGGVCELTA